MVAFVFLFAAFLIGADAGFKCNRRIDNYKNTNQILELEKLLTLESVCLGHCKQGNCSIGSASNGLLGGLGGVTGGKGGDGKGPVDGLLDGVLSGHGLLGQLLGGLSGGGKKDCADCPPGSGKSITDKAVSAALNCLVTPDGSNPLKLTGYQTCVVPCILDLNLLDKCDVQAIVTKLLSICPNGDLKSLCVSACLCCQDDDKPADIDVCANLCLSNKGLIDLNICPSKILGLGDGKSCKPGPKIEGFEMPGLPVMPLSGYVGVDGNGGNTREPCTACQGNTTPKGNGDNTTKKPMDDATTKKQYDDVTTKKPMDDATTKKQYDDVTTKKPMDDATTKKQYDDRTTQQPGGGDATTECVTDAPGK